MANQENLCTGISKEYEEKNKEKGRFFKKSIEQAHAASSSTYPTLPQKEGRNMNRREGNLTSHPRNSQEENDNVFRIVNSGSTSSRPNPVPRHPPVHQHDNRGGMQDAWSLFEERVRTGPFGLSRFPSQPHSPIRVLILDDATAEMVNPRLQQFIRDSPPRIRGQWERGFTPRQEPGLSHAEFKRAMSKMRTDIFNPAYPRKRAYKRGLFSSLISRTSNNKNDNAEEEDDDDGKECSICLEEFVPNQKVLVTPCNHMFHKECIAPWVKSHGKCPVCRFVLGERREQSRSNSTTNINDTLDLIAIIRAMEEAMDWVNAPPY